MSDQNSNEKVEIVKKRPGRPPKKGVAMSATRRSKERRVREEKKELGYQFLVRRVLDSESPEDQARVWHWWTNNLGSASELVELALKATFTAEETAKFDALADEYRAKMDVLREKYSKNPAPTA